MFSELKRYSILALYTCALFFSVPLSLCIWFVRRELCTETSVAGEKQLGGVENKKKLPSNESATCPDVQLHIE
ncbi:hypothetical protein GCK72_024432 [Caenorhabditis remanei]|uniref:Uncharacterized protein n=1 Tax=Caenorhabditis remanei TaxID=31234 RepID=A0A6A5FZ83_CAERE|nr:hypothetical protein GCK72_024432 [Caenorhabditis remanei]KAF1747966.1 hypothetical protein GCK72_024432 [Caenorhabditis remanei]